MDEALLDQLVRDHILPLFPGTKLVQSPLKCRGKRLQAPRPGTGAVAFRANDTCLYRLTIRRSPRVGKPATGSVTGVEIASAFVDVLQKVEEGLSPAHKAFLGDGDLVRRTFTKLATGTLVFEG